MEREEPANPPKDQRQRAGHHDDLDRPDPCRPDPCRSNPCRSNPCRSNPRPADPRRADNRRALGQLGEQIAAEHLERLGYIITARNERTRYGEIDLIASGNGTLVFAEVKTRRRTANHAAARPGTRPHEDPLAWLRASQRQRIRRLARAWLAEHAEHRPGLDAIRFDAIGVLVDRDGLLLRLDHIEGAW